MKILRKVNCFSQQKSKVSKKIVLVKSSEYSTWLSQQNKKIQNIAAIIELSKQINFMLCTDIEGQIEQVVCVVNGDMYDLANLAKKLPKGDYHLQADFSYNELKLYYLGFALGDYVFDNYKKEKHESKVKLYLPQEYQSIIDDAEATIIARDMISTPAEDMGPKQISDIVNLIASKFDAKFSEIAGEELVEQGYMGVYTVGRGSNRSPRLINLQWGKKDDPKISIVGKGVVFDTGGVDVKPAAGMLLMHKDMGGAANAIALAYLIMKNNLPVRLSLTIPAVENAIDANSYRPSDIISMREGTTVQITNTDAEGRVILAEPLNEESLSTPDLLINFATLTGAARVAVGTEIAAFFTRDNILAQDLYKFAEEQQDEVWRLPLSDKYKKNLKSDFADISNCAPTPFAGSITAALFLDYFVANNVKNWIHFDIMAWNASSTSGKPIGGEAMGVRACYAMIKDKYFKN